MGTSPPSPLVPDPVYGPIPSQVLGYQPPQGKVRPTSVSVLAILGIVFSLISILNQGTGLVLLLAGPARLQGVPELRAWNVANAVVSLALALVLLYSSIGCWKLRPWARRWIVSYAWVYLVWLVIAAVVSLIWVLPATMAGMPATASPQARLARSVAYTSAGAALVLLSVFPVLLILFMSRATTRTAFGETTAMAVDEPEPPAAPARG